MIEINSNLESGIGKIGNIRPLNFVSNDKFFTDMTEADLIFACRGRQNGAVEHLLKRHERTIANILYQLAPDFTDTSDILQEASIRIWRSIPLLKNPAAFKRWVRQIVTHLFYDELRKRPRQFKFVSMDDPGTTADGSGTCIRDIPDSAARPDEAALRRELSHLLKKALSTMPEQFRAVVILRDVEGLTYEEIATITRTELGTVKSRIARGRRKAQQLLDTYVRQPDNAYPRRS